MMYCEHGTFNGTGAAIYLCLGFIPDELYIFAGEDSDMAEARWFRDVGCTEVVDGVTFTTGTTYRQIAALTAGTGIQPYEGGDTLTAALQTSTTYGEGVYLGWDLVDYKADTTYGSATALSSWTLDTSANRTGHFNADTVSTGNRIGEGSRIIIKQNDGVVKEAIIEALTAGQGVAADEVTLSRAISTGTIQYIGGMYRTAPLAVGKITPAGVKVNNTTLINVNDEINFFRALKYA